MKQTFTLVAAFTVLAAFALPEIQNFSVTQGNDRVLSVSFELSEKAIVTMDMTTNGVSIGADNYQTVRNAHANDGKSPAGKVTAAGQHLWTWRPNKEWPGYLFTNGEFAVSVKAWSLDSPPDYMVLDSATTSNATFYVSAADLPEGGLKTADPNDAEALAALLNDVYRTTKLVLRKIPAAGVKWRMGSPTSEADRGSDETPHYVTLTNDYYVSIYPVTYYQYAKFVSTSDASYTVMPKSWTSYINYRGAFNTGEYCWPENGHDVAPGSSFGLLRKKTGFLFDFLTEAEWEYACRAGTTGRWCGPLRHARKHLRVGARPVRRVWQRFRDLPRRRDRQHH